MIWLAIYLYFMGATLMWWWARAQQKPLGAKIFTVLVWPLLVPTVALWG